MSRRLAGPLYGGSVALGVMLLGIGARWSLDGEGMAQDWGVPFGAGARKPLLAYTCAAGVRDIAFGLALLALAGMRDRRAVGVLVMAGAVVGTGDGFIS